MNKNYLNCFIEACKSVAESFGMEAEPKEAIVRKSPYPADATIIVIGVTGQLHGQAIISMDNETSCHIASIMMGGAPAEMNETTKSAVSELSNMFIGNSVTLLSQQGVLIDITPPSVLTGENIFISTNLENITIPFDIDKRTIEISLNLKEN